jgi:dethiobiotin synthetase
VGTARGLFVTGTDTGVGKTVLAAAIVAALRARGVPVRALKPVITGLDEPRDSEWPPDHELLAQAAGCQPNEVAVAVYGPAVSPHLAARLAGAPLSPQRLRDAALCRDEEVVVIEGVGGLLVPLADGYDIRSLALDIGLPVVIAARPGLGTINHTLLTLEAARTVGLDVLGVVLTPWPHRPGTIEYSNRETIEALGALPVCTLPRITRAAPQLLAAAGAMLPLERWLASRRGSVPSLA